MEEEKRVRRGLTYNVEREPVLVPEMGRIFQRLARNIIEVEDPVEKRYKLWVLVEFFAHRLHKEPKEETYRLVWEKLYQATQMQLDINGPWGKPTTAQKSLSKPKKLKPKQLQGPLPRWGTILPRMLERLRKDAPEEEIKKFGMLLAAFMFFGSKKWHSTHINPELIAETLAVMSNNKISLSPQEVKQAIDRAVKSQNS